VRGFAPPVARGVVGCRMRLGLCCVYLAYALLEVELLS
jgi:hypothetical protein